MSRIPISLFVALCVLALGVSPSPAPAQTFNSGSTGANGAFPPVAAPAGTTAITLDLRDGVVTFRPGETTATLPDTPQAGGFADGILHFTTFDVPTGVTLSFIRNPGSTPVVILAQGAVTISGTIDVSGEGGSATGTAGAGRGGRGGPGGFRGGNGEVSVASPGAGAGLGPGGGSAGGVTTTNRGGGGGGFGTGGASDASGSTSGGGTYGTTGLVPLVGGSGGGGGPANAGGGGGGGGGAGAILIASSATITVNGSILAKGGAGAREGGAGGSGGAIRLVANTLAGGGTLSTAGGAGTSSTSVHGGGAGGNGRVRLEAFFFSFNGPVTGVATNGGVRQVFLPNPPAVRIASVGGQNVSTTPVGNFGGVDVNLPGPGTVPVVIAASRVPLGTTVAVTAKPESDLSVIGPVTSPGLAGTFDSSTTTVNIDFPSGGIYFIEARATFNIP